MKTRINKKQAIEIYALYNGVSKAEATRILGKNFDTKEIVNSLKEMQNGLKKWAQESFYED